MPVYEYNCPECGLFEKRQRITENALKKCPTCANPVKRLISSNVNIVYKCDGFYVTDNRTDSYKNKAKTEKSKKSGGSEKVS